MNNKEEKTYSPATRRSTPARNVGNTPSREPSAPAAKLATTFAQRKEKYKKKHKKKNRNTQLITSAIPNVRSEYPSKLSPALVSGTAASTP